MTLPLTTFVWMTYALLWMLTLSLVVVVIALARQIGLVSQRIGISGARMENAGPDIEEPVAPFGATDIRSGKAVNVGKGANPLTVLLFVSSSCPTCTDLMPGVRNVAKRERQSMRLVIVSFRGTEEENREFCRAGGLYGIEGIDVILMPELSIQYGVLVAPYGLVLDSELRVRAKGLVNYVDHLDSLLTAAELGVPFVAQRGNG